MSKPTLKQRAFRIVSNVRWMHKQSGDYGFGQYLWLSGYGIGRREANTATAKRLQFLYAERMRATQKQIDDLHKENDKLREEARVVGRLRLAVRESHPYHDGGFSR